MSSCSTEMQARAISGPWAAGERILVCISEDPRAAGLVRYAKRLADRLHAPWTALYVEIGRSLQLSEEERDRIADTLRLAEALGGEAITIPGGDRRIADDVDRPMRRPTTSRRSSSANRRARVGSRSCTARWCTISCAGPAISASMSLPARTLAGEPMPKKTVRTAEREPSPSIRAPISLALLAVAVALGVGELIRPWLGIENVDLVFLTAVVAVAVRFGLWPSLFASVAASLCYNFFFTAAVSTHSRSPTRQRGRVPVLHAGRGHRVECRQPGAQPRPSTAMARARTTEALYAFSRKLAGIGTLDDVLWATAYQVALMLKVRVVLLLARERRDRRQGGLSAGGHARRGRSRRGEMGLGARPSRRPRLGHSARCQAPVPAHAHRPRRHRCGGHRQRQAGRASHPRPAPSARCADRPGGACHRAVRLVEDLDRAKRTVEADRLRSALLTSISHDLRTPLAAILGAAGTLRSFPAN